MQELREIQYSIIKIIVKVYMRPMLDIGAGYTPSYMRFSRTPIISYERSRRHSSSITRDRRSNSKNQRFDIAVTNITNINANISSLLNIVGKDRRTDVTNEVNTDRILYQSREKHNQINYKRVEKQDQQRGGTPEHSTLKKPFFDYKVESQFPGTSQLTASRVHASIKYSNQKKKLQPSKFQNIIIKDQKQLNPKQSDKKLIQNKSQNPHEISDWWENLLDEVDNPTK